MKTIFKYITIISLVLIQNSILCQGNVKSVTVPIAIDHNRMLVDGEMQAKDGSWRKVKFWVDTGTPNFIMSESLARDLGIDMSAVEYSPTKVSNIDIAPPSNIRIGNMNLDFSNIKSRVTIQPFWLFSSTGSEANIPATLLKKYHIIIDYPKKELTIAKPGSLKPKGYQLPVNINPQNGIVQIDATIEGVNYSFALDIGASYSFISEDKLKTINSSHPDWSNIIGTLGHANMWGWWPANEEKFSIFRIPQIKSGDITFDEVGIVGVPAFSPQGPSLGEWYSQKTAKAVDGFLGANVFKYYRTEIDYINGKIYLEKGNDSNKNEMDLVGISIRLLEDKNYQIVGIVKKNEKNMIEGIEPGDMLIKIDSLSTKGLTMGKVVDALRGKPGDSKLLTIERNGSVLLVKAKVEHVL